jgi:4-alpha-glucanotransferase
VETSERRLGATIPLFSLRSPDSWGIGEIADLPACAKWLKTGGFRLLQILPPHELARGENSPYGARTAFGLDPIYIAVRDVPDLDAAEIDRTLGDEGKASLAHVRDAMLVQYDAVRDLKMKVLWRASEIFRERELNRSSERAQRFQKFLGDAAAWENDLALYAAIRETHVAAGWRDWPEKQRDRDAATLARLREEQAGQIFFHSYMQWLAEEQWMKARAEVRALGVELMGDLPFVVGTESADVWQHPDEYEVDASLGAPPDAFTPTGQDWGLPPYRWSALQKNNFDWLRARVRRAAALYDKFRLDHLIGLFRMYVVHGGDAQHGKFEPAEESEQAANGKRNLGVMADEAKKAGVHLIAEDLGVIPEFVHAVMRELHVPGYRVIPWERDFVKHFYRRPEDFPPESVATWSTHDTAPIGAMWKELQQWERDGLSDLIGVARNANEDDVWRAQMRSLCKAGSSLALVLAQEIVGDEARINLPGTVGPHNWAYRLPSTFDALTNDSRVANRMKILAELAQEGGR